MKTIKKQIVAALILGITLLSGCGGGGLKGVYKSSNSGSDNQLEFKGGKVTGTINGRRTTANYKVEGDQIIVTSTEHKGKEEIWKIDENGCVVMRIVGAFCKE